MAGSGDGAGADRTPADGSGGRGRGAHSRRGGAGVPGARLRARASIGEIADVARAGKPTIYARYPEQGGAVRGRVPATARPHATRGWRRYHSAGRRRRGAADPASASRWSRRRSSEDFIGLMRLAVAEARAAAAYGRGPARPLPRARRPFGGAAAGRGSSGVLVRRGRPAALKAGLGFSRKACCCRFCCARWRRTDLAALRAEIAPHVRERARFFLAALRNGGLS